MRRAVVIWPAILLLFAACEKAAISASDRTLRPATTLALEVVDASDGLPNVIRYQDQYAFGIQDPETNLLVWAGLPASPMLSAACLGGSEPYATVDVQDAGLLQNVVHRVVNGGDVNLHVYTRNGFRDFCLSAPIAQGIGRMTYVDNDVFDVVSGFPGANAWGFRMEGPVTFTAGGQANLVAHNRFLLSPDGQLRRIFRKVDLSTP
jgi:hypothetical protein